MVVRRKRELLWQGKEGEREGGRRRE